MIPLTPQLVREVIDTTLEDNDIEGLIEVSRVMYDTYVDSSVSDEFISLEIRKYLAAHFLYFRDSTSRAEKEQIGDAYIAKGRIDKTSTSSDLTSTPWGQTAILFDPSGILRRLGKLKPTMLAL